MEIYISKDGQQQGPYSAEQLDELLQSETVTGDDFYWYEGCEGWLPLSQFPGFVPPPPPYRAAPASNTPQPESPSPVESPTKAGSPHVDWQATAKSLGTLLVAGFIVWKTFFSGSSSDPSNIASSNPPAAKAPSLKERLFNNPEERAKNCAQTLVLKNIKAPSTATFAETRIIFKQHPWYQVYVLVDAQNSFGAYIRSSFVCTLELGDGVKFSYMPAAGIQEMDDNMIKLGGVLEGIRAASNWPGANKDQSK